MTTEEKVWAAWLCAVLSSLLVLERTHPKLCHCIRRWLRIEPQRPGHRILGTVLVLLAAWFVAHVLDEHHR